MDAIVHPARLFSVPRAVVALAARMVRLTDVVERLFSSLQVDALDGIRHPWLRVSRYAPVGRTGRVLNILGFTVRVAPLRGAPVDAAILSSHFPLPIIPAGRLARRAGAALVFDVCDLLPLTLIELGGASPGHPFVRLLPWAEDAAAIAVAIRHLHQTPAAERIAMGWPARAWVLAQRDYRVLAGRFLSAIEGLLGR